MNRSGFSIIELLVVILILAILAAIAIPIFVRQRERAWTAQMQSSLKNAAVASESYAAGTGKGRYTKPGSGQSFEVSDLQAEGFKLTNPEVVVEELRGTANSYCIEVYHLSLGTQKPMAISNEVTSPTEGRCNGPNFGAVEW